MDDKADNHSKAFIENSDAASTKESQFVTPRLRTKSSKKKRRRRSLMDAASKKVPPGLPPPPTSEVETSVPATTEPCAHTDENATATRESRTHVQCENKRYGLGIPGADVSWHRVNCPTYPQGDRDMITRCDPVSSTQLHC
ncbi:uncharacterized protein [Dermacentor andersoni]|uniref:uncharacterized protein isoform X3 n=1 Tax=Dermacentor andersoni TaxID=34620 RepID=UPI002416756C|nr:uncharacterized protein LOC126540307 isoform X3 [Dermacentor andersoni]